MIEFTRTPNLGMHIGVLVSTMRGSKMFITQFLDKS